MEMKKGERDMVIFDEKPIIDQINEKILLRALL